MNVFSIISLASAFLSAYLGTFVFFKRPKSALNRLYMFFCINLTLQLIVGFGYSQSHSFEEAKLWWHLDYSWVFNQSIILHLVMLFCERIPEKKHKIIAAFIYLPAIVLFCVEWLTDYITSSPIPRTSGGWRYGPPTNELVEQLYSIWVVGTIVASIILLFLFHRKSDEPRKRKQALTFIYAVGSILFLSFVQIFLAEFDIDLEIDSVLIITISTLLLGYAIWKYDMFALSPAEAAESIIATMGDSLILVGLDSNIISSNLATEKILGYTEQELIGQPVFKIFAKDSPMPPWLERNSDEKLRSNTFESRDLETHYARADGDTVPISLAGSMLFDDEKNLRGFLLIGRDITERKKAADEIAQHRDHLEELVEQRTSQLTRSNTNLEKEIRDRKEIEKAAHNLEEQLHQAQKMEAIGRLAGGVAHDFNNLLFVINGYAGSLLLTMDDVDPNKEDVKEILEAAKRATDLTKQLLAFSRKQVIKPRVVDINDEIDTSQKMLSRLIGEDIKVTFDQEEKLGWIKMDPTQVNQILANLVVNARDAMEMGGEIHINTRNAEVTQADCDRKAGLTPGFYVVLTIRDTGCGIDAETQKKVFEPFFTTKGVGHGTGLGLATVYGIVKQNKGYIHLESKVGIGTSFEIYLPHADGGLTSEAEQASEMSYIGTETILLAEDNKMVRRLARKQLEKRGYRVIEAVDGQDALDTFYRFSDQIDLLLTDVVMPKISGQKLAKILREEYPDLKVIFMSGYNQEVIDKHGIVTTNVPFISKPFEPIDLLKKIRGTFDSRPSAIRLVK